MGQDFIKAIDKMYQYYVLRDIMSIMAPGALLIIVAICLSSSKSEIGILSIIGVLDNLGIKSIVLLFVFSYPVGFSLLSLGEYLGWIRICERKGGPLGFNNGSDWKEDIKTHFQIEMQIKKNITEEIYDERLSILRQMMATYFVSIVSIGILVAASYFAIRNNKTNLPLIINVLFMLIVTVGLWIGNRRLVTRHRIWRETRIP